VTGSRRPAFSPNVCRDVAAVLLAAVIVDRDALERQPREHRDAMIALLPVQRGVLIAEALEALQREGVVRAFGLLQADHVRPHRLDEARDQINPQANELMFQVVRVRGISDLYSILSW
jgi:hypothetical protein